MLQNALANWKTTSMGLSMIVGGITILVFAIKKGEVTPETITAVTTAILGGIGFLVARDSSAAAKSHEETKSMVADLNAKVDQTNAAIITGDTTQIKKG